MENPNHDQFEPDRVQTEQGKQRAKRALNRITTWIRSEIRTVAGPRDQSRTKMIDELARYLPDLHPDDAFGEGESGSTNSEKRFEEGIEVLEREVRRHKAVHLDDQSVDEHEGDGEDTGHEGGGGEDGNDGTGGDGTGSGEGEGEGGTGGRGGGAKGGAIPIRDVRLLPVTYDGKRLELSFVPEAGGRVELRIDEAGDSTAIAHPSLRILTANGWEPVDRHVRELKAQQRQTIQIRSDERIDERAWRVGAAPPRNE